MPTPLIISEADIAPLLNDPAMMDGAIEACEKATVAEYQGRVRSTNIIDRTTEHERANLLQIHFSAQDSLVTGFQTWGATPGNPQPNSRYVVLLDNETRALIGIVPYEGLSPLRVGASAGVAAKYLAPSNVRDVAILGSSKQARRQLQAIVRTVPGIKQVRVYSPTQENRERFARECSEWLGVNVNAVDSAEEAVRGAEIVDVATNTKTPAFEWSWLKPGALLMAIGGGQVPDEVLTEARVVVPTWESTEDPETGRDPYGSAIRAGKYTKDDIAAELGAVILGEKKVREDDNTTVVFDVGRINIWAVATTYWAYEWCRDNELGTAVSLSAR
jgi:alanine dehydrogenase